VTVHEAVLVLVVAIVGGFVTFRPFAERTGELAAFSVWFARLGVA